jgi:hypothetical protein
MGSGCWHGGLVVWAWLVSAWVLAGTFLLYSDWYLWRYLVILLPFFFGWILLVLLRVQLGREVVAGRGFFSDGGKWWMPAGVAWLVGLGGWLLWMALRMWAGNDWASSVTGWLWGGLGLLGWVLAMGVVGMSGRALRWLGLVVVLAAFLSACYSIWYHSTQVEGWHWGYRLQNQLVYGGWNAVCSGVTYAFAAVWAALVVQRLPVLPGGLWWRLMGGVVHGVLIFAALASLSRGALLVLVCGHLALVVVKRVEGLGSLLRFGLVFLGFHWMLPGVTQERVLPPEQETEVGRMYPRVIDSNPLKEWSKRGSTGRMEIYAAAWRSVKQGGAGVLMMGRGLSDSTAGWAAGLEEDPGHPHSVWVGALLHGGLLGGGGLLVLVLSGLWRAYCLRQTEVGEWGLVLAVAGLAGTLFDGQTVQALNSVPRFEPLLFWTGLALLGLSGVRGGIREQG